MGRFDARFAGFPERFANKVELVRILTARFAEKTTAEWLGLLRGHVPCAPVNTVAQALEDEQVRARDMLIEVKHPQFGVLREVASPVKTAGAITNPAPAPALGQHTEELLRELLHYPPDRIARLRGEDQGNQQLQRIGKIERQLDPAAEGVKDFLARYPKAQVRQFDDDPSTISELDAVIAYLQMLGTLVDFAKFDAAGSALKVHSPV